MENMGHVFFYTTLAATLSVASHGWAQPAGTPAGDPDPSTGARTGPPGAGGAPPAAAPPAQPATQPRPAAQPAPPPPAAHTAQPQPAPSPGGNAQQPAPAQAPPPAGYQQQQPAATTQQPAAYQQQPAAYQQQPATYQQPTTTPATRGTLEAFTVAFSAERMFGAYFWTGKIEFDSGDEEAHGSTYSFLISNSTTNESEFEVNPYATPRVAVDFFPVAGLSVGGSIGYFSTGGVEEGSGGSDDEDLPTTLTLAVAPRVGYAAMFTPVVGLWPRGGITYVHSEWEYSGGKYLYNLAAFTAEVLLVLSPVDHFAFTVGPVIDQSISANVEFEPQGGGSSDDVDGAFSNYGLAFGITGYL